MPPRKKLSDNHFSKIEYSAITKVDFYIFLENALCVPNWQEIWVGVYSNKNKKMKKFDSDYPWWIVYIENVNFVPDHLSVRLLFFHAMIHPQALIYFFCFSLQIMLSDASRSLYTALNRRVYFNQATVVVPSNWRDAKCKIQIHAPRSGSSYGVSRHQLSSRPRGL